MTSPATPPEFWLRGPVPGVTPELQPAVHALLQAREELTRAAKDLPPELLWAQPGGAASVGFHVRHAGGALERLLTYARGEQLSEAQRAALAAERTPGAPAAEVIAGLDEAVERALAQYRATDAATLGETRGVGRAQTPSNVRGLMFHAAEHAQRHAGQAVTTAKIVRGLQG